MSREPIYQELQKIQQAGGGLLKAEDVVEFAKDPATALHSQFEWEDTEAARLYRLQQARAVIRLHVRVIADDQAPVRAFVSLKSDRADGGGYRATVDVLADEHMRTQLLQDALRDLHGLRKKYEALQALRPVWEAMARVAGDAAGEPAQAAG